MEETTKREQTLDFRTLLFVFTRHIWLILAVTVLGAAVLFVIRSLTYQPQYTVKTSLYVKYSSDEQNGNTANDMLNAQKILNTYIAIMKSNTVLDKVADHIPEEISRTELSSMISVSEIPNTEILEITVTAPSPETTVHVATALAEYSPTEIIRIVKVGSVEILDSAKPENVKVLFSKAAIFGVLGGAVAFLLCYFILLIHHLSDTTIKTEDDLIERYQLPLLGEIPNFNASWNRGEDQLG